MKPQSSPDAAALRRAAESRLKNEPAARPPNGKADQPRLQHELEVHQNELEMQNEELRKAQAETAAALERYSDHFDFAPVGYFNLTPDGTIRLVNLTGATLMGRERSRLVERRFGLFVAEADRRSFSEFLAQIFASKAKQSCELDLAVEGRPPLSVRIEATASPDGQECRAVLVDITEHKQAEANLAASERRLRAIFESEPECVKLLAADGTLLDMNPAGLRMIEADSFQQVDHHCVYPLVVEEYRAAFRELTERVFHGESGSVEFQVTGLKGGRRWLETHATPLRDDHGKIISLLGITRDITERRQAEAALRESEARYHQLFAVSPDAVFVVDRTGRFLDCNETAAQRYGYSRAELLQMSPQNLAAPDLREQAATRVKEALATGGAFEWRHRRKDGSELPVEISAKPFEMGGQTLVLSSARDITERKRAEEALRKSRERLQTLLESITDGVVVMDPDWRYLLVNRRAEEMLGYPIDELLGKEAWSLFPEGRGQQVHLVGDRVRATGVAEQVQQHHPLRNRWYANHIYPSADGITIIFRDITDQMHAEATVRENEERHRSLIETTHDLVQSVDAKGCFLFVNRAWCATLGWTAEEARRLSFRDVLHPDMVAHCVEVFEQLKQGRQFGQMEVQFVTKSGREVILEGNLTARFLAGQFMGTQSFFRDITERKKAEAALRESETRYRTLFEAMDEGFCVIEMLYDPAGQPVDYRFLETNPAFVKQTGLTEALTKTVREMVPDLDAYWFEIYGQVARTGESIRFEHPAAAMHRYYDVFAFRVGGDGSRRVGAIFNDITARKQAEAVSRESEERLRLVTDTTQVGLVIVDPKHCYRYANPAYAKILRLPSHELVGLRVADVLPSVYPTQIRPRLERAFRGERVNYELSVPAAAPDQEARHYAVTYEPRVEGAEPRVVVVIFDITERKEAEAAVRESERNMSEAQRIAHVGSWSWNLSGPIQWTDELYRIYGVSPETFAPTVASFFDLVYPADRPAMREWMRSCGAGESPDAFEFRAVRPDGTVRFVSGRGELVRDAGGRPMQLVGTAQDITERKQADVALHEAEARLRLSVAASNIGLWDWNLVTNEVYFSREWKAQLGYAEAELQNQFGEWERRVHPDDLAPTQAKLRAFIEQPGAAYAVEFRLRHKDGSWRWIFTQAQILRDAAGQPARMVGCHLDITARKQAELELRASHEQLRGLLARLQRAREEERMRVAREVHDELGQLLTGLKMDVRWLERRLSEHDLPRPLLPLLDRAVGASALADATLATVQKIAAELRPGTLDRLGLAAALQEKARAFQARTGVACTLVAEAGCPEVSAAQATELFYICQEALTNVTRHAHATRVEMHLRAEGEAVVLEVRDDGVGLAEAELHAPRSLGLLGMRERAAQCGGTVGFERNEPQGTRVTVRVPRANEAVVSAEGAASYQPGAAPQEPAHTRDEG